MSIEHDLKDLIKSAENIIEKLKVERNNNILKDIEIKYPDIINLPVNEQDIYKTIMLNDILEYENDSNKDKLPKDIHINLLKLVIDRLMVLGHLVGIQPMKTPVQMNFILRYINENSNVSINVLNQAAEAKSRRYKYTISDSELNELSNAAKNLSNEVIDNIINFIFNIINDKVIENDKIIERLDKCMPSDTIINKILMLTYGDPNKVNLHFKLPISITTSEVGLNSILFNMSEKYSFVRNSNIIDGYLTHIGEIKENDLTLMKVLIHPKMEYYNSDMVLISQKELTGQFNAGVIYSPYKILSSCGWTRSDPTLLDSSKLMNFFTRYALISDNYPNNYLLSSKDYYNLIEIGK